MSAKGKVRVSCNFTKFGSDTGFCWAGDVDPLDALEYAARMMDEAAVLHLDWTAEIVIGELSVWRREEDSSNLFGL